MVRETNSPRRQPGVIKAGREGVVREDESYTIEAFCKRLGIKRTHLTDMRRRGLVARQDGRKYVRILGSDYHEYLRNQPVAPLTRGEQPADEPAEASASA